MYSNHYALRTLYQSSSDGLKHLLHVYDITFSHLCPTLSRHLTQQGIECSMYVTSWMVTIYAYRFTLPFTESVWNRFIKDGLIVVVQMGVAIMKELESKLLTMSFEQLVPFLTNLPELSLRIVSNSSSVTIPHVQMNGKTIPANKR